MFFELHGENRIGYKELSDADLGRSGHSHQTHIGLFDDVLTFLSNRTSIKDAMVIYNENAAILPLLFDRIQNPDGTYRSPKIRAGRRGDDSVLSFIRNTVKNAEENGTWYLFWFGLQSKQPVFLLVNKNSKTYEELCDFDIPFRPRVKSRLTPDHSAFQLLIKYLEGIVNVSGRSYAEELELMTQTDKPKAPNIRKYNFEKARIRAQKIGREGEQLVNNFFEYQKSAGEIKDFQWSNSDGESGLPYDFWVEHLDGELEYLDVKTTDYRFEQKMIFSDHEIKFASDHAGGYRVYRVYCNRDGDRRMRICNDIEGMFVDIHVKTSEFKADIIDSADLHSLKLAISPCNIAFALSDPIAL